LLFIIFQSESNFIILALRWEVFSCAI